MPPKISFFVDDLSSNAIVRAAPLADALQRDGYEVEIVGLLVSGSSVYAPYRDRFAYKTIRIRNRIRGEILDLTRLASGDILYACKPLPTTLLPALLSSRFGMRCPVLLDAEDDELWDQGEENMTGLNRLPRFFGKLWRKRRTYALQPFTRLATGVTVVSRRLQRRYGGVILLHGPNEREFDPALPALDSTVCRRRFGLPEGVPLVLFAGLPHAHKGLDTLVAALGDSRLRHVQLVLAGDPSHPEFQSTHKKLPGRVILVGMRPNAEMPSLVGAVDIVPVPQHRNRFTESQVPAKLLEGMAMGRRVTASRVSDLALILGEGEAQPRGWVHDPGDSAQLASCLDDILTHPQEAARRAVAARRYFLENASVDAIRMRLRPIMEVAMARLRRPS